MKQGVTKGFDLRGTLVDLKGDASLMQEHAQGKSSQTCTDDKNLGSFGVHNRTVVLKSNSWVDLHGDVFYFPNVQ